MANIKICTKCGKTGLDQYDFRIRWHKRDNKYRYRYWCIECQRQYCKQYQKQHYHEDPDYRNRILERGKQWQKDNKEHRLKYDKQWREDNKEHKKKLNKQWGKDNPDKRNAISAKRRAMKLNQTPANASMIEINKIYSMATFMNEVSVGIKWHVDHIIPLSKGGLHHQNNLQILESIANIKKGNKIIKREKVKNV